MEISENSQWWAIPQHPILIIRKRWDHCSSATRYQEQKLIYKLTSWRNLDKNHKDIWITDWRDKIKGNCGWVWNWIDGKKCPIRENYVLIKCTKKQADLTWVITATSIELMADSKPTSSNYQNKPIIMLARPLHQRLTTRTL